ncbi:MAG: GAF domain-containing sensor histidine kinase [Chloroflexota bacterium]|nr:GAF domain-containing sensor histidine kinase [Chloroflexota bacterium]
MSDSQQSSTHDASDWRDLALAAYGQVCAGQPDPNAFHCYIALRQLSHLMFVVSSHGDKALKRLTAMHGNPVLMTHPDAGIAAKAMREHRTLLIADATMNRDYKRTFTHMKSQLAIPLVRGTTTIGSLVVECIHPNAFGAELVHSLEQAVRQFMGKHEAPYNKRGIRDAILKMHLSTIEDVYDVKQLAEAAKPVDYFITQLRERILPILSERIQAERVRIVDMRAKRHDLQVSGEQYEMLTDTHEETDIAVEAYEDLSRHPGSRNKSSLYRPLNGNQLLLLMVLRNATGVPEFLIVFQFAATHKRSNVKEESERAALDTFAKRLSQLYLTALIFEQQREHNEEKQQFIQDVVHQLNSLAHALLGYCENLIDGIYAPGEHRKTYTEMLGISLTLEKYIQTYTLMSHEQRSLTQIYTHPPELFDADQLIALLQQCRSWFSAEAIKGNVRQPEVVIKDFAMFPPVMLRAELFELMIFNLLDNAVKYSAKDKNAPITIGGRVEPGCVVITITNHGIELKPEDTAHIFRRGYRTGEANRILPSGTGIGLHLCLRVMELHHGAITALPSKPSKLIPDAHEVTFEIGLLTDTQLISERAL